MVHISYASFVSNTMILANYIKQVIPITMILACGSWVVVRTSKWMTDKQTHWEKDAGNDITRGLKWPRMKKISHNIV